MWFLKDDNKIDAVGEGTHSHRFYPVLVILSVVIIVYILIGNIASLREILPFTTEYKNLKTRSETSKAIEGSSISACSNIENLQYKNICIDNVYLNDAKNTLNIDPCRKLSGTAVSVNECLLQVLEEKSIQNESIAICSDSGVTEVRERCEDNFYVRLAALKNDIKICENYSDLTKKKYCIDYLSGELK